MSTDVEEMLSLGGHSALADSLSLLSLVSVGVLTLLLVVAAWLVRRQSLVLRFPARFESIRALAYLVDEYVRDAQLDEQAAFSCRLALDEAITNIIRHSYAHDPEGEIEARIWVNRGVCEIHLTDFGLPYDPKEVETPQLGRSLDEIEPGGLGLYLMRACMDEVHYTPGPRGNRLILVKRRSVG